MTNILTFPGLGLEFALNPIAFRVFGWPIHWYGIIIATRISPNSHWRPLKRIFENA